MTRRASSLWCRCLSILALCVFILGFHSNVLLAEWLPSAHDVFQPLQADPRELQYALRAVLPVGHRTVGEAAMGDYLGLYRWDLGEEKSFQLSAGGGVFGRFDLSQKTNDLQTTDFYGNLPFDFRAGDWSTRFMIYHTSAHLGDDYLKRAGRVTEKHAWDNIKWLLSYDVAPRLRLYSGYTYVFRTLPGGIGRHAIQGGFELKTKWMAQDHLQYYWANDFQAWERARWNPMVNSQIGFTMAKKAGDSRAVSIFIEYEAGRSPQGQFYLQKEARWNLGIQFHLT